MNYYSFIKNLIMKDISIPQEYDWYLIFEE